MVELDRRENLGLQGTLDAFALPDVLRLLAVTRKTGCLRIESEQRRGSVWLCNGGLTGATIARSDAEGWSLLEVVLELARADQGSFHFVPSAYTDTGVLRALDVESTLHEAGELFEELRALAEIVPSSQHRVAMASHLQDEDITLDSDQWKLLRAIADRPAVTALAERLGFCRLDVTRAVCNLVDLGVAIVEAPTAPQAPSEVLRHQTGEHAILSAADAEAPESNGAVPPGYQHQPGAA